MMADRIDEAMLEMGKIRKFIRFSFGLMMRGFVWAVIVAYAQEKLEVKVAS